MILLVHSCDGREWLRPHWERYFRKSGWDIEVQYIFGDGEFTDRLIETLQGITDEYIWYTLDDYLIVEPIYWQQYENTAINLKADALRLQPNVQHNSPPYHFKWQGALLKQTPNSAYTMSMQTSIWRREYFLKCLPPGLDPWELESFRPKLGNVYFVPRLPFWYIDSVRRGIPTEKGKKLING